MNFQKVQKIYMIGIKGVGMTAIAQFLKLRGKEVTGSDIHEKFFTDQILKKEEIKFYEGFNAEHLVAEKPDLIIYSTAYTNDNIELRAARESGLLVLSYPEALGAILKEGFGIAVCGTHGKTTTTAMLGFVLQELSADPTVIVGSAVPQLGGNARAGRGKYVVIEADEYQNKFLHFEPQSIVLTSAEYDHPDFFKTPEEYKDAFKKFVAKIPAGGFLVACFDDKNVREIAKSASCKVISYGLSSGDWRAKDVKAREGGMEFEVFKSRHPMSAELQTSDVCSSYGNFFIQLTGSHNVANALAVIAVAAELGYGPLTNSWPKFREALKKFQGTVRRFEIKGEAGGVLVIDDYGHHPTEVRVTLEAARQKYPNQKIWCVFHPHTFTRTKALLGDFAKSFGAVNKTIVIDIYGSAREKSGGVHSRDLVELIKKENNDAIYIPTIPEVADYLTREVKSSDVVITMGAGDVWRVGELLLQSLRARA